MTYKNRIRERFVLAAVIVLLTGPGWVFGEFAIRDGDRVVIYGDSITDNQLYPRVIEDYVVTRFPRWEVQFWNRGWGGDTAHYYGRFERDCLSLKPTLVLICLGMNDAIYRPFDIDYFRNYVHYLNKMVETLEQSGARVFLISPPTYDVSQGRYLKHPEDHKVREMSFYPEVLREFSLGMYAVSTIRECGYIALNRRYAELLARGRAVYGDTFMMSRSGDAVHPFGPGQLAMGVIILEGLGAVAQTGRLEIDGAAGEVLTAEGYERAEAEKTADGMICRCIGTSLPMPVYDGTEPADTLLNVAGTLNRDMLVIRNLEPGMYMLTEDERHILTLDANGWAKGVNLSERVYRPEMAQSKRVAELTQELHEARYEKWRKILCRNIGWVGDAGAYDLGDTEALKAADEKIEAIYEKRKEAARPLERVYVLKRL